MTAQLDRVRPMSVINTRHVRRRCNPELPTRHPQHDGASLKYSQIQQNADPQPAAPETHFPRISRTTAFDANAVILVDANGIHHTNTNTGNALPPIQIINSDSTAAYSFCKLIKNLDHHKKHGELWGEVWSCLQYTMIHPGTYKAPERGNFVAIKKLNKRVVDSYLNGVDVTTQPQHNTNQPQDLRHIDEAYLSRVISISDRENPYREMSRMDEFGDNEFVLRQIEFLQDDEFVYIVMPHACELGSLDYFIFNRQYPMTPAQAQAIFVKILRILTYLEQNNIHHRDMSPDNFIFLNPNCLVLMDFAMSVKIPVDDKTGQRTLILTSGRCGTLPFMPPEVYHIQSKVLDGVSVDLWAAVLILYSMLTKKLLYRQPDANIDIAFRYFVYARAITKDPCNQLMADVIGDLFDQKYGCPEQEQEQQLLDLALANLALTPDAQDIFHHVLHCNPAKRWTLRQVLQSNFCTRLLQDEESSAQKTTATATLGWTSL